MMSWFRPTVRGSAVSKQVYPVYKTNAYRGD